MFKERPIDTVARWINDDWLASNGPSLEELTTKLHSISNETTRTPDSHFYRFENGILKDPDTGDPILKHIAKGVEYYIAEELQRRVAASDEGVYIWNSPALEGVYPCNKTLIYQIAYDHNLEKVLLYSAILYNGDIENPEEHRGTLISAPDSEDTLQQVLLWIETVSHQKQDKSSAKFSRQDATYFAEQFKNGTDPMLILQEMQRLGFVGENSISCPIVQSFSNYSSSRGKVLLFTNNRESKYIKNCGACGASLEREMRAGERCPRCNGVYQGC